MYEPGGSHVFFGTYRRSKSPNGGMLDVDANGIDGIREDPVENIFYSSKRTMKPGTYRLEVNNYNRRDHNKAGFEVEIEALGETYHFSYDKALKSGGTVVVCEITHEKDGTFTVSGNLPKTSAVKTIWSLPTQSFHPVRAVMLSPNFWDDNIGNKHYFFMLEGAKNPEAARGFYNEFLNHELDKHRKVLELVGAKLKVSDNPNQLSGLGFSSTQRATLVARVKGSFTRTIHITF